MTMRPVLAWLVGGAVGMSAGCDAIGRAANAVGELIPVHHAVQARVEHGTVRIRLDEREMTVLVFNSRLRGLPTDRKSAKARELAIAAYQAYANRARLTRVRVVFAVQASIPFVRYDDRSDGHDFDVSALGTATAPASLIWNRIVTSSSGGRPAAGSNQGHEGLERIGGAWAKDSAGPAVVRKAMPARSMRLLTLCAGIAAASVVGQSPAVQVVKVTGDRHQLALKSDGTVVGWGQWAFGQLGPVSAIGVTTHWTDRPVAIELAGKAVDVAAGDSTSYAVLDDGTVWAWGDGRQGELGTGPNPRLPLLSNSTTSMEYRGAERPVKVAVDGVAAIVAVAHRAVAVLGDGTVREWPRRRTPDGDPSFLPTAVPKLANVTQVSASWTHTLALTADGRVWAWGGNDTYALGVEPKGGFVLDPVEVPGLIDVKAVAAVTDASLVLKRDGTVWAWGSNGQGQFGNGQRASHPTAGTTPTPARVPGVANVVDISAGTGRQVLVLLKDGTLRGWGNTDWGQLGAGVSATFQLSPVAPKITGVKAVFASGNSSFAVKIDGSLWGWGAGDKGRWPFQANTKVPTAVTLP